MALLVHSKYFQDSINVSIPQTYQQLTDLIKQKYILTGEIQITFEERFLNPDSYSTLIRSTNGPIQVNCLQLQPGTHSAHLCSSTYPVYLRFPDGLAIKQLVKPLTSVKTLISRLNNNYNKTNSLKTHVCDWKLIHKGKLVSNANMLVIDYLIQQNDIIHAVPITDPSKTTQFNLVCAYSKLDCSLQLPQPNTFQNLQIKLAQVCGVPVNQQILYYAGIQLSALNYTRIQFADSAQVFVCHRKYSNAQKFASSAQWFLEKATDKYKEVLHNGNKLVTQIQALASASEISLLDKKVSTQSTINFQEQGIHLSSRSLAGPIQLSQPRQSALDLSMPQLPVILYNDGTTQTNGSSHNILENSLPNLNLEEDKEQVGKPRAEAEEKPSTPLPLKRLSYRRAESFFIAQICSLPSVSIVESIEVPIPTGEVEQQFQIDSNYVPQLPTNNFCQADKLISIPLLTQSLGLGPINIATPSETGEDQLYSSCNVQVLSEVKEEDEAFMSTAILANTLAKSDISWTASRVLIKRQGIDVYFTCEVKLDSTVWDVKQSLQGTHSWTTDHIILYLGEETKELENSVKLVDAGIVPGSFIRMRLQE